MKDENGLSLEKLNADRITRLEGKVDRVIEMLGSPRNGDWKMVAVILSMVVAASGLLGQNILFLEKKSSGNTEDLKIHSALYGHPGLMESKAKSEAALMALDRLIHQELNSIHNKVDELDVKIQQEIVAVREYSKEQTRALDEKLQIEFGYKARSTE